MVPYLRVANVFDGYIDYSDVYAMHFSEADQKKYTIRKGDILLNEGQSTELVGRSAIFEGPEYRYCYQNSLVNFRCGPLIIPQFARAVFKRWLDIGHFTTIVKQTTSMAHLGGTRFANLEFPVPPLLEQRCIAQILDTLDKAIRKSEQLIAKLKHVKQGFLHDLLTRGIDDSGEFRDPERHPEQFKDSQLGQLPRDWEIGLLEGWLAGPPKNGYSPESAPAWTGWLMLGLGCLTVGGFAPVQLKNAPSNDKRLLRARLNNGDLLMSRANTRDLVGFVGRFEQVGCPCSYPDLMMRLVPRAERTTSSFMELVLSSNVVRRQIQAAAVGTSESMVKISGAIVRRLVVGFPPMAEQLRVLEKYQTANARIATEEACAEKLRALKQGLMEDLLTGRVRVTSLLNEATA